MPTAHPRGIWGHAPPENFDSLRVFLLHSSRFVASSAGLVLFCLGADHAIFRWEEKWLKLSHGVSLRAVSDSMVHGLVGGWCWANVLLLTSGIKSLSWAAKIGQVVLCVVMATVIDLDHLIEARSFSIKVINYRRCFFACVMSSPPPKHTHPGCSQLA